MINDTPRKPCVLVVDDMSANVQVLAEALVEDHDVKVALSGQEALDIVFSDDPPDLILLDIIMPGMDGYEVCRRLKHDERSREIPVIFVTIMDEMDDETRGFDVGGVDYITKPICVPIVRARVKAQLELKRNREELKEQNRILKENLRLREDVESIVRHDLKTPLSVFLWAVDLLSMDPDINETQQRALHLMKQATHTMTQTLNSAINVIKMERGEYMLNPANVDIIELLHQILSDMYGLMAAKHLNCHIYMNGGSPGPGDTFILSGERILFYTMLANLLKNAMEASDECGTITIRLDDGARKTIRIQNSGCIPESIREVFFEKYITSNKKLGTGLGTYSARLMAKTQKGDISFTTSEAEGTTVTVSFPNAGASR
ncbi:hybrid sensor histidine kinase/response regulator [Desulfatiferula olefinivorans]